MSASSVSMTKSSLNRPKSRGLRSSTSASLESPRFRNGMLLLEIESLPDSTISFTRTRGPSLISKMTSGASMRPVSSSSPPARSTALTSAK